MSSKASFFTNPPEHLKKKKKIAGQSEKPGKNEIETKTKKQGSELRVYDDAGTKRHFYSSKSKRFSLRGGCVSYRSSTMKPSYTSAMRRKPNATAKKTRPM